MSEKALRKGRDAKRRREIRLQLLDTLEGVQKHVSPSSLIEESFANASRLLEEDRFDEAAKAMDELGVHLSRWNKLLKLAISSVAVAAESSRELGSETIAR